MKGEGKAQQKGKKAQNRKNHYKKTFDFSRPLKSIKQDPGSLNMVTYSG